MGAFWSKKVGSDTYYASYERSFEVLKRDIDKIKVPQRSYDLHYLLYIHAACFDAAPWFNSVTA